ncbi:MAG: tRNA (guanosine(46)-N7)-methyltransferase TrmB [Gammaproteobacteria bacterium]|nr:tRNA (guanosine(46)-N7)-methyltransferase TrmB [Gammaproteobacteria bacterium]MXX95938.1 tRNA (guanosine(46)-N7)-methyltransferase TrmB [Gammaproteobacteria bacterium]MYF54090.1 tRNA (guanosine(46)-N7)-methyltransferase TrmB [Gammaproteobacteria bacterium]MYK43085.1 tRNA (guanosine(46)-N7)-methyltransferase TrmB [Gammaproteobacteria bacterium]
MSAGQARGYAKREHYSIELEDLCSLAGQASNLFVEIGFGDGKVLASLAHERSDWTCIGIDVYRPGIGALIQECENTTLDNVHILETDAISALEHLPDRSINLLYVLFPDPWPKRRHHFRRLINEEFVGLLKDKLATSGEIYVSTDWEDYANQIEMVMTSFFAGTSLESTDYRSKTRYEIKAEQAGHQIWNYLFRRCS